MDNRLPSGQDSSHLPNSPPHNVVKLSGPEPLRSPPPPPQPALRALNNRELPPTPADREARRESLPPMERLDRLTRGQSLDQGGPRDPERRKSSIGEQRRDPRQPIPRSRSVGPQGYRPTDSPGQGEGRSGGGRMGERDQEAREERGQNYGEGDRFTALLGSPGRRPPPSQGPRPYQRPASVMGQPSPSSQQSLQLRQDSGNPGSISHRQSGVGERETPRMRAEPMVGSASGPVQRREGGEYGQRRPGAEYGQREDYGQSSYAERPKSVPPHLFHGGPGGEQNSNMNNSNMGSPVAAPRHGREVMARSATLDGAPRDRDSGVRSSMDGSVGGRVAQYTANVASSQGKPSLQSSASLPSRYSGPGGPQTSYSSGGSTPVANHNSMPGRSPPQQHAPSPSQGSASGNQGGPGSYQGGGRHDPAPGQPGAGYGRSITPGPRHGSEPYGRDAVDASNPYSTPHRPHSSLGRAAYHGNMSNPPSSQHRLLPGSSPPGPQHPYRQPPPPSQDGSFVDHNHRPVMDHRSHGSNPTPMARIPPQTKAPPNPTVGRVDPASQRTAVGDEQPHDRPKKNSVWYEYGCV